MLPKNKRLNLKTNFKSIASGERQETYFFKVFFKQGENLEPKIGIALSKSIFKKASSRSKTKRLTSAAVRSLYPLLRKNLNLVIMPKVKVLLAPKDVLIEDLKKLKDIYENKH